MVEVDVSLPEKTGDEVDKEPLIEPINDGVVESSPAEESLVDSILAEFPEKSDETEQEISTEPVEPEQETAPLVEVCKLKVKDFMM